MAKPKKYGQLETRTVSDRLGPHAFHIIWLLPWPHSSSTANHWSSPTRVANIENMQLRGGGSTLKQAIWDAAKETISEWTHATLHESSLYGIRVYTRGSVLSPHVDRLPLVSSAIICVDTDVEEPWPLEVIGHDGRAYNITMEPGDMVLCK